MLPDEFLQGHGVTLSQLGVPTSYLSRRFLLSLRMVAAMPLSLMSFSLRYSPRCLVWVTDSRSTKPAQGAGNAQGLKGMG